MTILNDAELNELRAFLAAHIQSDYAQCSTAGHGFANLDDRRAIDGSQPAWTRLDETKNSRLSYDANFLTRFSPDLMKKAVYAKALLVRDGNEETLLTLAQEYKGLRSWMAGQHPWNPKWDRDEPTNRDEAEFIRDFYNESKAAHV